MQPPRAPFTRWPIERRFTFGFCWTRRPLGVLATQYLDPHLSVANVHAMHDWVDQAIEDGALAAGVPATVILDLRAVRTLDAGIREVWLERSRARPGDPFAGATTYVAVRNPVLRMGANTIALQLRAEQSVHFIDDPAEIVSRFAPGASLVATRPG